jgi:hypothetical protein
MDKVTMWGKVASAEKLAKAEALCKAKTMPVNRAVKAINGMESKAIERKCPRKIVP